MNNRTEQNFISSVPSTGRIGRFIKILSLKTDNTTLFDIIQNSDNYNSFNPEQKALWWKQTVERMESKIGRASSIEVMNSCGAKCCGSGQRKTAQKLMKQSNSIEDFLNKISNYEVKYGELEYKLIGKHTIIAQHKRCFCGQVKNAEINHNSDIYCQCSVEFNKQFFTAALNKNVEVTLCKSILLGDDMCEFNISIIND